MISALLLAVLPLQDSHPAHETPEIKGFHYTPGKQMVGTVYHYKKSNVDGSRPSHVDLYMASETRIEAFKYSDGHSQATLVVAEMDWKTFSVGRFETTKLYADGRQETVAILETKRGKLHCKFGELSYEVEVKRFPWHTYDFDLASLNMSLRYLKKPKGVVLINMVDEVLGRMKDRGFVELLYLDDEQRGGVDCRHYNIDGPGLYDRGGELWVRKGDDPVIVDYEIDLPDESSMQSGKMVLMGTEKLTAEAWAAHKRQVLKQD